MVKGSTSKRPGKKSLLKALREKLKRLLAAVEGEISGFERVMEPSVLETSASYSQVARREASIYRLTLGRAEVLTETS